jgi:hypothetical protein
MEERESLKVFDQRLDEVRGSIDDMVRNGSIISNSDGNSPFNPRRHEENPFPKESSDQPSAKAQKVRTMVVPSNNLALTK